MLAPNLRGLKLLSRSVFRRFVVVPASGTRTKRRRQNVRSVRQNVSVEDLKLNKPLELTDPRELEFKLRQLREFTKNLQAQVRMADDLSRKEAAEKVLATSEKDELDTEDTAELILGQSQMTDTSNLSSFLLSTAGQAQKLLPQMLLQRINDDELVLKSLINHRSRNWNTIVSKLYDCPGKLNGVSHKALKTGLLSRVTHLSLKNIRKLDLMLVEYVESTGTQLTTAMYECLFQNLSNLKPVKEAESTEVFAFLDSLLQRFDSARTSAQQGNTDPNSLVPEQRHKAEMNQFILNCCIKFASKMMDASKLNNYLTKFNQEYRILPNRENYTAILQFYNKLGLNRQAWDVFATMKFLSAEHKPDAKAYTSMLQLCVKEKNYAKAIDLFNEMSDLKIEISAEALNAVARVLAVASGDPISSEGKAESLRLLGWKYLHQNEDLVQMRGRILEDTIMTMMTLCAYDGDVGLARALYFKYVTAKFADNYGKWRAKFGDTSPIDYKAIWSKTLNPYIFNYLLLAYAKFSPEKLPLVMGFDQGAITRRNLINSVDYQQVSNEFACEVPINIPMLPVADFSNSSQVILESRALWQFNLEFGGVCNLREAPKDVSKKLMASLDSSNSLDEFAFTTFNQISAWRSKLVNHHVLNAKTLVSFLTIPIKMGDKREFLLRFSEFSFEQQELNKYISVVFNEAKMNSLPHTSESTLQESSAQNHHTEAALTYLCSMKHKLLRDSVLYELAMRAAIKFRDVAFARDTWESRGAFRKLGAFQKLDAAERASKDSVFASLMVDLFTNQEMYTDSMGIIMSSQRHINWKYPMVKKLHHKLIELEDENSIKILLGIVNKRSS
ncbi:LAME_0F00980g1_1 [Lachancea meyersii CBS 8951]|uniref:LAME_0F00980g1_1 n=1 Tax=Lachancea meyersii CBS 8951 TaxID=1266667 RepID=A0A1G4JQ02_9SACH|nr:LAME_0F00980g1_1 [Lachancea meyersii CBS 8951]